MAMLKGTVGRETTEGRTIRWAPLFSVGPNNNKMVTVSVIRSSASTLTTWGTSWYDLRDDA